MHVNSNKLYENHEVKYVATKNLSQLTSKIKVDVRLIKIILNLVSARFVYRYCLLVSKIT